MRGLSLVVAHGLLIAVASPVAEHRLWVMRARWCVGFVALWHVESSQTRDWTCVPCTGQQVLNHCTTREVTARHSHTHTVVKSKVTVIGSKEIRKYTLHRETRGGQSWWMRFQCLYFCTRVILFSILTQGNPPSPLPSTLSTRSHPTKIFHVNFIFMCLLHIFLALEICIYTYTYMRVCVCVCVQRDWKFFAHNSFVR